MFLRALDSRRVGLSEVGISDVSRLLRTPLHQFRPMLIQADRKQAVMVLSGEITAIMQQTAIVVYLLRANCQLDGQDFCFMSNLINIATIFCLK